MSTPTGRFAFDPTKVNAGIPILDKGDYEFTVTEARVFNRTNTNGEPSYGVRYSITVARADNPEFIGKRLYYNVYLQSEASYGMAKAFVMAGNGYTREQEDSFNNSEIASMDWGFDPNSNESLGDAWKSPVGKRVIGTLDIRYGDGGVKQQQFKGFRPL